MKNDLKSIPLPADTVCNGKPSLTDSQGCTDTVKNFPVKAISESIREESSQALDQPVVPPVVPPACPPREQTLGFTPKALIAMANNNKLPEQRPLGFAPRALIARANSKQ